MLTGHDDLRAGARICAICCLTARWLLTEAAN
jgi:hypothetical protein